MGRTSRSEGKNSPTAGWENPATSNPLPSSRKASLPTAAQRLFLWIMTALLAGWVLLLSLLAWWSCE
ncbi:MAG: hypothetical protein NZ602_15345 [Thermoguttaceae bacterium]|nr:hypothetical protein [Thermoguttaceae bacterium]MDW8039703.1 hypothetical protein [Thermoguttaceae bacterium]